MPTLMEFHEKYKDHRDKFEIIAFHSASAPNFEMLDKKMKPIIKKVWGGKDIPFPSLLDATGQSLRSFSIVSLGTHVLINPEGNVVPGHGEATIEAGIKKMIEDAAKGKGLEEPTQKADKPSKKAANKRARLDPS